MKDSLKTDYQVVNMPIVRVVPKPIKNNSFAEFAQITNHNIIHQSPDKNMRHIERKGSSLSII
jgi:hypothetical protein